MKTTLMAIGGAMDLDTPGRAALAFHALSGGPEARIVILPTASELPEAGQALRQALLRLGVRTDPIILPVRNRAEALAVDCAPIRQASAVFFAGGAQLRITTALGGTNLEKALLEAYAGGVLMAGSSAGAAVLSQVMLSEGRSGPTPRLGMAQFCRGLGFTTRLIFDQHFRQRDRLGRLILAVTLNPGLIGVGVDEDTAAIVTSSETEAHLEVVGRSAVTIVDSRQATATDVAERSAGQPVAIAGLIVHVLTENGTFDLSGGLASLPADTGRLNSFVR